MSPTLGKRKDREDEEDTTKLAAHGSTLFVSNLPYTATSVDLQTLFSDIAPVRSAFVVTEHGSGVSKGVGYVSFAIKEDAQMAYDAITKDGLSLVGRNLRIEWADKKHKDPGNKTMKEPKPKVSSRPQQPRLPQDPLAIRTVVISGLPPSIDSKVLWKKVRKYNGVEKVESMSEDNNTVNNAMKANVVFTTPAAASEAVSKLHAHIFKGRLLSVTLKKRLETLSKSAAKKPLKDDTDSSKGPAPNPSSRLIVRNLPFNATEQDLRAAFLPYGPIYSIHIPTAEKQDARSEGEREGEGEVEGSSKVKPVRTKGFAFVWMLSRKDAEKAIEGCNGMTIRAGSAESLAADKQKKKKQRREEKRAKLAAASEGEGAEKEKQEATAEVDEEKHATATERVIAVDWALSKNKWEEERAKMEENADVEMDDASGSVESDDDSDASSESDEEGRLGVHRGEGDDDSEDEEEEEDEQEDEEREEPVKPTLPPPEAGTTLFIRNLPFSATEDELRTLFSSFGPLRYARITMDHETGRSRGTGFVCFWNKEDGDKAIAQSDLLRAETTGVVAPTKKNPFTMPSILTPDPSSSLAQSLVLHGRTLDAIRAVTRDEVGKLKEAGEKSRQKADKRNIYLLREGVILPNTPAAGALSPQEVEQRTASFNARRQLLKSNPSLFISKTRLSVRQIPLFVSERLLKRLAIHAIKAFESEAKKGDRLPLSADELADIPLPEPDQEQESNKSKKKRFMGRQTGVKQTKIVRQMERVDPVTCKGRSKGYGFLELNTHADALRVLRWANNNPEVGSLFEEWWKDELKDLVKQETGKEKKDDARLARLKEELEKGGVKKSRGTLICEFSIENIQVVQRRKAAQAKAPSIDKTDEKMNKKEVRKDKEGRSFKKRRVSEEKSKAIESEEKTQKPKNNLGALIGRKRKERKARK
ncbi:hypothetical protein C0995_010161 [Termitomyces sp. Mi166|nr:hypothetical protein C0995_010161 [Termitomyces sp. Mi166\